MNEEQEKKYCSSLMFLTVPATSWIITMVAEKEDQGEYLWFGCFFFF